jgi:small subunit ribosomal protein S7
LLNSGLHRICPVKAILRSAPFCPDPKHGSETIARFINMVMQSGKKSVAERIVYGAIDVIGEKNAEPARARREGAGQRAPSVEVKSRRVGGATYQVPVEVRSSRRMALAMRWLIESARKRGENIHAAQAGRRAAGRLREPRRRVKKREETHRMAEANKAFAHYRW